MPTSSQARRTASRSPAASDDGLSTTVLPVTIAAVVMPARIASGKFHGGITTPTPSGMYSMLVALARIGRQRLRLREPLHLARVELAEVDRLGGVGVGLGPRLADSSSTILAENSCLRRRRIDAIRRTSAARSSAGVRLQAGNAFVAAFDGPVGVGWRSPRGSGRRPARKLQGLQRFEILLGAADRFPPIRFCPWIGSCFSTAARAARKALALASYGEIRQRLVAKFRKQFRSSGPGSLSIFRSLRRVALTASRRRNTKEMMVVFRAAVCCCPTRLEGLAAPGPSI